MKKNFLSIADCNKTEIFELLQIAGTQKRKAYSNALMKKNIALLFEKPSLRTKASFETGIHELGGTFSYFTAAESGRLGERESIEDHAHMLSLYYDLIVARVHDHVALQKFAEAARAPVLNALSDKEHPCQVLADLFTIKEHFGKFEGIKVAYLGDGNNVALSLAIAAEIMGFEFMLAGPQKYHLTIDAMPQTENVDEALANADVIYTDTWVSMGEDKVLAEIEEIFMPYQLNTKNLAKAKPEAVVMHCLPAHRGLEITDRVMDGKQSIVLKQAANRLPAQKALMIKLASISDAAAGGF
jgi:ornithine carbamoyltransferase